MTQNRSLRTPTHTRRWCPTPTIATLLLGPVILTALVALPGPLVAAPIFPAGAESKAAGMESGLRSEGAPSVLYNPANLSRGDGNEWAQPYAELGLVNVNYTYEHPEFDPVLVSVTSPTLTLGYSQRLNKDLTVGAVVFPSAAGKLEIPGLPRKIGGAVTAVEAESQDLVVDLGVGASLEVGKGWALGASLILTEEQHARKASLPGNQNPLVDLSYRNTFARPALGARYVPVTGLKAALAFRPAMVKEYRVSQNAAAVEGAAPSKVADYEPATISGGIGANIRPMTGNLEVQHQAWEKGKGSVKNGVYADDPNADLKDSTQYGANLGYRFTRDKVVSLGYAHLPSPWGAGQDDGTLASHVYGVDFGQLNAVDLDVVSLGGKWQLFDSDVSFVVFRAQGEREIKGTGDNLGYYTLGINAISGGIKRSF